MQRSIYVLIAILLILVYSFELDDTSSKSIQVKPHSIKKNIHLDHPIQIPFNQISNWLCKEIKVDKNIRFVYSNSFNDKIGFTHHKFYQTYKGLRVQDGVFKIHTKNGFIISANGEYYPDINVEISIQLSPEEAIEIGKKTVNAKTWAWDQADYPKPELFIISTENGYRPTYKTDIFASNLTTRKWVYVDSEYGEVVAERNQIYHFNALGEAHCYYHGLRTINVDSLSPSEFLLRDYTRGNGIFTMKLFETSDSFSIVDFVDEDNIWGDSTNGNNHALDVHWASGEIYDYMKNVHNWDSYDNQGTVVLSYVQDINDNNTIVALWNGTAMVFGKGNGTFFNPLTAAEIVGHEFMHAYSNNMVEWNVTNSESNALNESFSDIFSVIFEFQFSPETANYLSGEMVTVSGDPIRDFEDPNSLEAADTYLGEYWNANGAGITNTTVFSHAFYLLTQGGSGTNDNGDDYEVFPISLSDAADILIRTLSVYLTPSTNFIDVRTHGIQACIDLYGPCSFQEIQFTNACYAIGVGPEYPIPSLAQIQFIGDTVVSNEISFSSNTSDAISWEWDFGDNTNSNHQSPIHIYQSTGSYEVTLTATYPGGCTISSTIFITIIDDVTSVEFIKSLKLLIYPNPVQNNLYIEFNSQQTLKSVRAVNILGQSFFISNFKNVSSNKYELDISTISSGVYFLELVFENDLKIYKKIYLKK